MMVDYISAEIRDALHNARELQRKSRARLRVQSGDLSVPILRHWAGGFAVDARNAPQLRGFVQVCRGLNPLYQALIVAATEEEGELRYEFKRSTPMHAHAPLDFERCKDTPAGYLPSA